LYSVGELVWIREGLFSRQKLSGFAIVIRQDLIDLDECQMVCWKVLLSGKLVEVDATHIKKLKWYNKHLCNDGFQKRAI
jgi:hypothetical protein